MVAILDVEVVSVLLRLLINMQGGRDKILRFTVTKGMRGDLDPEFQRNTEEEERHYRNGADVSN